MNLTPLASLPAKYHLYRAFMVFLVHSQPAHMTNNVLPFEILSKVWFVKIPGLIQGVIPFLNDTCTIPLCFLITGIGYFCVPILWDFDLVSYSQINIPHTAKLR